MKKNDFSALAAILAFAGKAGLDISVSAPTVSRVKPWLSELNKKCKRGATSLSITTRQRTRALERAEAWSDFRMKRTKKGRPWNQASVTGTRSTRRDCARIELRTARLAERDKK